MSDERGDERRVDRGQGDGAERRSGVTAPGGPREEQAQPPRRAGSRRGRSGRRQCAGSGRHREPEIDERLGEVEHVDVPTGGALGLGESPPACDRCAAPRSGAPRPPGRTTNVAVSGSPTRNSSPSGTTVSGRMTRAVSPTGAGGSSPVSVGAGGATAVMRRTGARPAADPSPPPARAGARRHRRGSRGRAATDRPRSSSCRRSRRAGSSRPRREP